MALLSDRLGLTHHISPLRRRIWRLMHASGAPERVGIEDWLLEVANSRGACFVTRDPSVPSCGRMPDRQQISNEELVAAICQVNNDDRPQLLRAAAQLVSRGDVDADVLVRAALRERGGLVLREIAKQALRVDPVHSVWVRIAELLGPGRGLRSPIMHWSRIAVPVPDARGVNASAWRLIT